MRVRASFFHRMLAATLLLLCMARPALCLAADPPEGQVRTAVETLTVTVQVWDPAAGRALETGSGIIVSDSTPMLTVLTARHVVEAALAPDAGGLVVRVRFNGSPRWIDAASKIALSDDANGLDAAAVLVARDKSPLAAGNLAKALAIAPQPQTGTRLWVFALDPAKDTLAWRSCASTTATDATVAFDGEGIVPGCSGGPVLAEQGLVGLVRTEGARNRDHAATPLRAALLACVQKKVPIDLSADPVRAALDNTLARGLSIGVSVSRNDRGGARAAPGWVALEPAEVAADRFTGRAVSPDDATTFAINLDEGRWRFSVDAVIKVGSARLSPGVIDLKPMTGQSLDGFVLLVGTTTESEVILAIPSRACELFGTRAILGAAGGRHGPDLPAASKGMFATGQSAKVKGKPGLFALALDGDSFLEARLELKAHKDQPVRVSGLLALSDDAAADRNAKKIESVWSALNLELRVGGETSGRVLSSAKMRLGERVALRVEKAPELMRLRHSGGADNRSYGGMSRRGPLLVGLTIEYTP